MSWLDKYFSSGYTTIYLNGVAYPARSIINFIGAGFTIADDASLQSTDITNAGTASTTPVATVPMVSSTVIPSPATNTTYRVSSASAVTATISGTPVDGVILTFVDVTKNWRTKNFTFTCQAGATATNPENVSAAASSTFTCSALNGESFSLQWSASASTWLAI